MLPPIWPSDGVDSPAFWLAVLMWCVFFVVMRLLGKKTVLPAVIVTVTGKKRVWRKKKIRQSLPGVERSGTLLSGRVDEFLNSVSGGNTD